ncbi:MAG: UDP-3-O-(3-hydroxymyristoyl)glucosamine N-acyltransferase [Pseudomonadota bacterium]
MPVDLYFHPPRQELSLTNLANAGGFELPAGMATLHADTICEITEPVVGGFAFLDRVNARKSYNDLNRCTAILCRSQDLGKLQAMSVPAIGVDYPREVFQDTMTKLFPDSLGNCAVFADETAVDVMPNGARVARSAKLEEGVNVGPYAIIGDDVEIGRHTKIGTHTTIAQRCKIGRDCDIGDQISIQYALIGDHVTMASGVRLGQEGFGFVPRKDGLKKLPQLGRVVLQDNVELGANTTVDRGTLGDTSIGAGTKIDNLVQIAHNVKIGVSTVIAAHAGLSGSSRVGNFCMLGGRVGLADQVSIGDGAMIAAASGVMHDVPAGERWGGIPAQPMQTWFREAATLRKLAASSKNQKKQ